MDELDLNLQPLPEAATHHRRSLLGAGLGGLLLMSGGLFLSGTELTEAANNRAKKRRRRRSRRRRKALGRGLLRNFAFTIVNDSNKDWWFGVGWQEFIGSDIEKYTVAKHSRRRIEVEDDEAMIFVPDGSVDPWGNPLGRTVHFSNPLIGEVDIHTYSGVTFYLDDKSIRATISDPDSDQEIKVGESRTFDFGFVTFVVRREQDSQKYKEFTITFS
jgi:hypothetical protein